MQTAGEAPLAALSKSTLFLRFLNVVLWTQLLRLAPGISEMGFVPDSPSRPDWEPELGYCGRPRLRLLLDAEDASKSDLRARREPGVALDDKLEDI